MSDTQATPPSSPPATDKELEALVNCFMPEGRFDASSIEAMVASHPRRARATIEADQYARRVVLDMGAEPYLEPRYPAFRRALAFFGALRCVSGGDLSKDLWLTLLRVLDDKGAAQIDLSINVVLYGTVFEALMGFAFDSPEAADATGVTCGTEHAMLVHELSGLLEEVGLA